MGCGSQCIIRFRRRRGAGVGASPATSATATARQDSSEASRRVKSRARELQQTGSELRMAVERSETAHRTLLEHLPVHVLQKDLDGRLYSSANRSVSCLVKPFQEVLGKTDYDFYEVGIADKFRKDDLRVVRDGLIVDDVETNSTTQRYGRLHAGAQGTAARRFGNDHWRAGYFLGRHRNAQWPFAIATYRILGTCAYSSGFGRGFDRRHRWSRSGGQSSCRHDPGYQQQGGEHPPLGDIMRPASSDLATTDSGTIALRETDEENLSAGDPVLLNRLLKRATGRRIEVSLKRPDDSWFDAEISAHPLVVENSSGWAIFIRDITRRKKSVAELQLAKEALSERTWPRANLWPM